MAQRLPSFLRTSLFRAAPRTGGITLAGAHGAFRPTVYRRPWIWGAAIVVSASLGLSLPTIHLDAQVPILSESEDTLIDPDTSIAFPTQLRVPSKTRIPTLSLVGVGVRTVSFLGVKVYSVGFYADLDNKKLTIPKSMSPEEKLDFLIRNVACVIRIVPTRSTSYTHLRDAFMRALQQRMVLGKQQGTLSPELEQDISSPMRKLKSLFPNTPLPKHTPLDIFLSAPVPGRSRALVFRDLGAIESDWVATEFMLTYFEGSGLSPALKRSTMARLESFER